MALGIVQGSQVSTPNNSIQISAGPFQAAADAKQRLDLKRGQAAQDMAGDIGGFFGDVAKKFQQNQNTRTVLESDLAMRKSADDFRTWMATHPDEETWLPQFQDQSSQLRDQILSNPRAGPDVKRQLTGMLDSWDTAHTGEIGTAARLQSINRTRETATADSTYAAQQGDVKGGTASLTMAYRAGAFNKDEYDRRVRGLNQVAQRAQIDTAISTNPIKASRMLADPDFIKKTFPNVDPKTLLQLQGAANAAKNRQQIKNGQDILEDAEAAPDGAFDLKAVARQVKSGDVTQKFYDNLKGRIEKTNLRESREDFNVQMMEIQNHDFTADKDPDQAAREMHDEAASLPSAYNLRAAKFIQNRYDAFKKKGESEERPIERDIFDRMKNDPLTRDGLGAAGKRLGLLEEKNPDGSYKEDVDDREGQITDAKQRLRNGQMEQAEKFQKMRDWFADPANKDAKEPDAEKYRQSLNAPSVEEQVKNALRKRHNLTPPDNSD